MRGRISIPFPCEPVFKKNFGLENVLKKGIGLRKKNVLKNHDLLVYGNPWLVLSMESIACLVMEPHGLSSHGARGLSSSWGLMNDFIMLNGCFLKMRDLVNW